MGITRQQALDCFASDDLIGIGMEADAVRRRLHPEGVVTYLIDRTIDCTGPETTLYAEVREAIENGATGISIHPTMPPSRVLTWYESLLRGIKQRTPGIWLHGLSATEILALAAQSEISLRDTLMRLHNAGLDSISGNDAGILDDTVTRRSCPAADWLSVHRAAHRLGMKTTASMIFGLGESADQRISHFEAIGDLQRETGGFTAFIPTAFQPGNATSGGQIPDEPTSVEYLKTLAISRIYLDNIPNVQGSCHAQGLKVLQMALRFGGNDAGSVTFDANAPRKTNRATEEDLRRIIRGAGFKPVQRDTLYRTMFLN